MSEKQRFELFSTSESPEEEKRTRKSNNRLKFGLGVAVLIILALATALAVVVSKSNTDDNNSKGSEEQDQKTTPTGTTVPSTTDSSHTTKPKPVLTTTDPGQEWIQEPCQSQESLKCPWKSNPVVLVSLDGFRADYLKRNLTPTLQRLASCGVHTPYMRAMYPTLTFPNHYTIVTGLYPESHGIVDNNMYDSVMNKSFSIGGSETSDPRWWGGEPLWVTAKRQGKKTATYFWVGSDVNISGVLPDIYYHYDGSVTNEERIDTVLDWLSWSDKHRPDLITVYFSEPDHTGHGHGPDSPEVDAMLGTMDKVIDRLMNGLYRRQIHNCVNLVILADHGMESTSCDRRVYLNTYMNTKNALIFDGVIGRIHRQFHEEHKVVKSNDNIQSQEEIERLLRCKSGHVQMFNRTTMPVRHHYVNNRRIGDIVLDMQRRWTVAKSSKTYCLKGNHGFDNIYKSMQALFLAHGPDFKQGIGIEPFENIELYNMLCDLLKISPAPNNGTTGSLHHLLHSPPPIPTSDRVSSPDCQSVAQFAKTESCFCSTKVATITGVESFTSPVGKPKMTSGHDVCIMNTNDTSSGYSKKHHMPLWTSFILYPNQTVVNTTGACVNTDSRAESVPCGNYSDQNQSISHDFLFNPGFQKDDLEVKLNSYLVPMFDGFRNGIWEYTFRLITDYASQRSGMEIFVGPAFDYNHDGLDEVLDQGVQHVGDGYVPLPTHYYIIVLACKQGDLKTCTEKDMDILSFVIPHIPNVPNCMPDKDYLLENVVRIRDIELLTGIKFLTGFPVETAARLTTYLPTSLWKPKLMALKWTDLPCMKPNTRSCSGKVPLLLISLDGFRADYVTRKLTPVIEKLRTCGVHTPYMRSVYPTVTFPNHYTIATGLYPESHGIVSNNMYDNDIGEVFSLSSKTKGDPRWWGGEPIWNTAKKQGKKAYTFFWPGSDVNISGSYPEVWKGYDGDPEGKSGCNYKETYFCFPTTFSKIGFPERLDTVIDWLTLPEEKRPDIVTLYFDEPDHAGHQKGPESEMVNGQLETVDDMLGRLMNKLYQKGLQDCVNMIVIADHGMQDVSCSDVVKLPEYMPEDIKNVLVFDGTFGHIENDYARISKYRIKTDNVSHVPVTKIMDDLMCKNPAMKVFTKEIEPKRFHYRNNKRIGDILLDLQDGWLVSDTNFFWCTGGNHGWDNLFKSMHALFLAHGPAFRQEVEVKPFENIELYNLMSEILGITPAPNNGTVGTLHHILMNPGTVPVMTANMTNYSLTKPTPVCGCSGNISVSVPLNESHVLPYGVPANVNGKMYVRNYSTFSSGFTRDGPLWTTVNLPLTKNKKNETDCFVTDINMSDRSCSEYNNNAMNLTLRAISQGFTQVSGVNFLSSLSPMYDGFYSGIWSYAWKLTEHYSKRYGNISVTVGPIYDYNADGLSDDSSSLNSSTVNENSSVIIPTHFYMILMKCKDSNQSLPCNGEIDVQSYILPHVQIIPNCQFQLDYLKDNVARIRDIELLTGLQFLTENIDQDLAARLRTYLPVTLWPEEMIQTWLEKSCTDEQGVCQSDYQPLILISLDGFRADYLLRNFTPYVRKLSQCGSHAPYMRSVYPTKTFPNHYSIVTGLYPESHGIIDNNMYDETIGSWFGMSKPNASDPRWWKGEPIWNTVKKHNKTSATYFWPGSDVSIQGMYPDIWKKYNGRIPFNSRVDELLTWLSLPPGKRPDFATLYFDEPDHAGHNYGPDDIVKIGQALDKVDKAVGRLMEGLYRADLHNCANIIIVADHGMSDNDCNRIITARDYLTQYNNMYIYEGAFSRINPKIRYSPNHPNPVPNPVSISDIIANLSCKTPHIKVFEKSLLPKRHHYANTKRIADIVVDVEDRWLFTYRSLHNYNKKYCQGGNHGYDNAYKSMNALFLAHGPVFKQNFVIEPFENIELYNLMSGILNISAAPNNGTIGSLYKLLKHPPKDVPDKHRMNYSKSFLTPNISLSPECLANCPSFADIKKSSFNKKAVEIKHTPFGIPDISLKSTVNLLYSPTHVTGYNVNYQYPVWSSYTLDNSTYTQTTEKNCELPDERVTHFATKTCLMTKMLPDNFTPASLRVSDGQQPNFNKLSSLYVTVYKEFMTGIWSSLMQKIKQWSMKNGPVNIITGPAFDYDYDGLPDTAAVAQNHSKVKDIPVPSHIFLIVTKCTSGDMSSCSDLKTISFILPNIPHENNCLSTDAYLTDNEARIRDIELLTGKKLNILIEKKLEDIKFNRSPAFDYDYDGLPDTAAVAQNHSKVKDIPVPSHIFLIVTKCTSGDMSSCSDLKTISFILPNIPHENNCLSTDAYLTDNEARIRDIELLTGKKLNILIEKKLEDIKFNRSPAFDYDYDGLPDTAAVAQNHSKVKDIPVPSHIFLIVTKCTSGDMSSCSDLKTISFILPNIPHENNCLSTDAYLTDNEARIRDIELLTGLKFFTNHKDNIQLRTFLPHGLWTV